MARFMIGELPEGVKLAAKEFGERLFDALRRDRDRVTFASTCLSNGDPTERNFALSDQILKTKPNTDHDQPMPDDVRVIVNEMREAFTVSRSTPAWAEAKDQVEAIKLAVQTIERGLIDAAVRREKGLAPIGCPPPSLAEELDLVFEPGLMVPCLGVPIFNDKDFGVIAIDTMTV